MKVILVVLLVLTGAATAAASEEGFDSVAGAILRLQVAGSGGTAEGTCFLVHQETREAHVVLYFLTAGHLLDPARVGEQRTASLRIRVMAGESGAIETTGRTVVFPGGIEQDLDLAVFSVVTSNAGLTPVPIAEDPPQAGETFVVRGYRAGELSTLTERVRFRSTRIVIGDRTAGEVHEFVGAPAMGERGAFGIVTECSTGRVPVITLLGAARGFLTRALPGWAP
jgi:hypothetical protein